MKAAGTFGIVRLDIMGAMPEDLEPIRSPEGFETAMGRCIGPDRWNSILFHSGSRRLDPIPSDRPPERNPILQTPIRDGDPSTKKDKITGIDHEKRM